MYNFGLLGFTIFMATFASCDGNLWTTKGLYTIVILCLLALNVNDIIEVIIKEDDKPRNGLMGYLDNDGVKYEVIAGLVSTLLLIYAGYNRGCGFYYIIIIILAPIVLVLILYIIEYLKNFLGLTEFSVIDYLPNSFKRLNVLINIIPTKNGNNNVPDTDILNTESTANKNTSSSDSYSEYSTSKSDDSISFSYDDVNYNSNPNPSPSPSPSSPDTTT